MIGFTSAAAAMVMSAALSTATSHIQPPVEDLYHAAGYIESIGCTSQDHYSVNVELTGFSMPYDGHIFTIDLSAGEMGDWMEEQGSVATGDRVFCWMDSRGTATILDDSIDHISK